MLYEKLFDYNKHGIYPFHIPGHKRNGKIMPDKLPYDIDITEISGFDDLYNADGVLLEVSKSAAQLYDSREAFLLVNGTTVGILAAIGAHTKRGDKILAVSNCHWSTPNAANLFGLELIYIKSQTDEETGVPYCVSPKAVEAALNKNPEIKMVVITSPTYEGVVSDIASIAKIAHNAGALLLVDAAHGAHLGFSEFFPKSAVKSGADIVVVSIHKTLPALTQCSLLHACTKQADIKAIKDKLFILQTSSPSYVLMASIDYCLQLLTSEGENLFDEYKKNLQQFYSRTEKLKHLTVLYHKIKTHPKPHSGFYDYDPGKIVIITKNSALSSTELSDILREKYLIETERKFENYVIALTSICDTPEGFAKLSNALIEIDSNF